MARIRTIKPEFWTDEEFVSEHSRDERLFFASLLNYVFDNGTGFYRLRSIKRETFPFDDDIAASEAEAKTLGLDAALSIEGMMKRLAGTGRVIFYQFEGKTVFVIPNFGKHQRVNRPTPSPIPLPEGLAGFIRHQADSLNAHGVVTEDAPPEGKGRERKGTERKGKDSAADAAEFDALFARFWTVYPRREAPAAAKKALKTALKKTSIETIVEGVERYTFSPDRKFKPLPATWLNQERWNDWREQQAGGDDGVPSGLETFDNTAAREAV